MSFHLEQQYPIEHAERIERDQPGKSNAVLASVAVLFATTAILLALFSIYLTFILQWQGPFRDLWEFVDDIERQFQGEWSWSYLLEAYGGAHRIFLPKLLFFADYYWLGGRNWLTITTALSCQFAYLFLIIRVLRQQSLLSTTERTILTASFALALFSTTQINNFLYAMDVQWYMSNLFGLLSLYALAQSLHAPRRWLTILLFGGTATLCNFTGLMVLPVAALVLLTSKKPEKLHWPLVLFIATICWLYVSHEKNSEQFIFSALRRSDNWQTSLYIVFDTLQKIIPYMLRYLASPLSREWQLAGYVLSVTGIAITLYYWIKHLRDISSLSNWQRLCLYLSTCIIASAFFTAFGRIIYPNSATAERYQTLVLPWLPALFGLIWIDARQSRYNIATLLMWTAIFGCYLLPTQTVSARDMVMLSQRVNLAHTAARAGVLEPPYILATLSYPLIKNGINSVKDNDVFLRSNNLGYFRKLPQFALDAKPDISATLPICSGYASMLFDEDASSWIVDGQLLADGKASSDIALLQNGSVVGIGTSVGADDSLLPTIWQPAESSHFRAFVHANHLQASEPLIAVGILNEQAQCSYPLR
ncbi:MAG TPA: hypothetical protein VLB90_07845 [Pseudomonadales bacterium]|nr:hypothetical protein [Pseudomonadales bacterium]